MLEQFVDRLLNDDKGLSEEHYSALVAYLRELEEFELLNKVISSVKPLRRRKSK